MLNMIGECHSLSFDALTAHVAIVNVQENTLLDQNDIIIDNSNAKDYVKKICLELFTDESKMEACFDLLTKQWVTSCNQEYQSLGKILQDIFEYCNSQKCE